MKIYFIKFLKSKAGSWTILFLFMVFIVFAAGAALKPFKLPAVKGDGKLHIIFFDVGQGDSELIVMPDGADVLIDGGPDGKISELLGETLPPYDRNIELIILTHPHADHLSGLVDVLKHYKADKIMMTGVKTGSYTQEEWLRQIKSLGIPVIFPNKGDRFEYGGAELEVLSPDKAYLNSVRASGGGDSEINDTSIVLSLTYGNDSALLMGDAGEEIEKHILPLLSPGVDILKVGHHGSKYSSGADFIKKVSPQYAVISSGADNKYGHPSYKAIRNLQRSGSFILRTYTEGTVYAESGGNGFFVKTENSSRLSCENMFFVLRLFLRCK